MQLCLRCSHDWRWHDRTVWPPNSACDEDDCGCWEFQDESCECGPSDGCSICA